MLSGAWGWLQDNWMVIYIGGAVICALLAALIFFVGLWWFAAYRYALGGLVLGWLPGGVAAVVAAVVFGYGWPLFAVLLLAYGHMIPALFDELSYRRS